MQLYGVPPLHSRGATPYSVYCYVGAANRQPSNFLGGLPTYLRKRESRPRTLCKTLGGGYISAGLFSTAPDRSPGPGRINDPNRAVLINDVHYIDLDGTNARCRQRAQDKQAGVFIRTCGTRRHTLIWNCLGSPGRGLHRSAARPWLLGKEQTRVSAWRPYWGLDGEAHVGTTRQTTVDLNAAANLSRPSWKRP